MFLLCQHFPKTRFASLVVHTSGAYGDAKHLRGLLDGHVLVENEVEQLSLPRRQSCEHPAKAPLSFLVSGILKSGGTWIRGRFAAPHLLEREGSDQTPTLLLQSHRPHDTEDPRARNLTAVESGPALEDPEVGRLKDILGFVAVPPAAGKGPGEA